MPRRTLLFLLIALVVALGCVRLGMWQLARLGERQARNALVVRRLGEPAEDVARLGRDTWLGGRDAAGKQLTVAR